MSAEVHGKDAFLQRGEGWGGEGAVREFDDYEALVELGAEEGGVGEEMEGSENGAWCWQGGHGGWRRIARCEVSMMGYVKKLVASIDMQMYVFR